MQINAGQVQATLAILSFVFMLCSAAVVACVNFLISHNNETLLEKMDGRYFLKPVAEERFHRAEDRLEDIQKRLSQLDRDLREVYNELAYFNGRSSKEKRD